MEQMQKNKPKRSDNREHLQFPEHQKKKIIAEIESGQISIADAMGKYQVYARKTIKEWAVRYASDPNLKIASRPRYDSVHRRKVAYEIMGGLVTKAEASRAYNVGIESINGWIREFNTEDVPRTALPANIPVNSSKNDKKQPKTLEQLQLKVLALETMIDIAEKELGIEIRKKPGTKQ